MRKIIYLVLLLWFVLACRIGNKNHSLNRIQEKRILTKLEKLLLLPQDSLLFSYGLSDDSLTTFLDLSGYSIKFLDW